MRRSAAQTNVMGAASVLGGLAAFWFMSVQPAMERESAMVSLESAVVSERSRVQELTSHELDARRSVMQATRALETASVELATLAERNSRLAELTQLAIDTGLRVDAVSPGKPMRTEMFTELTIALRGRGTFSDVGRFMHRLASERPDTEVRTFRTGINGAEGMFELGLVWRALPETTSRTDPP